LVSKRARGVTVRELKAKVEEDHGPGDDISLPRGK
jgi:hypothetical protein